MKYAIIKTGGKQVKVNVGSSIWVEKLDSKIDQEFIFSDVLAIFDGEKLIAGTPKINGKVKARVQKQGKGPKLTILRTKQKSNWSRKQGHRQPYTRLFVEEIVFNDKTIDKINRTQEKQLEKTETIQLKTVEVKNNHLLKEEKRLEVKNKRLERSEKEQKIVEPKNNVKKVEKVTESKNNVQKVQDTKADQNEAKPVVDYKKMTVVQLKALLKEKDIKFLSKDRKADLIAKLEE